MSERKSITITIKKRNVITNCSKVITTYKGFKSYYITFKIIFSWCFFKDLFFICITKKIRSSLVFILFYLKNYIKKYIILLRKYYLYSVKLNRRLVCQLEM